MPSLREENAKLRHQLKTLTDEARLNGEILDRFLQREMILLAAENLAQLLSAMTDGMRESFNLECVSLVLPDPNHEIRHLLHHSGVYPSSFENVHFIDSPSYLAGLKHPRLGSYQPARHGELFPNSAGIQSVALLPMVRHRVHRGCINLGSSRASRFTHRHSSDFLERLANVAALCLDNAVNREQLIVSGLTDALTGLHNRRYLKRKLLEETERAARYRQPMSCLFVDADHFKRINDRHGHQTGDTALRALADSIRSQLRASDVATRYGGEELAILLPHTDQQQARLLAERVRMEVEEMCLVSDFGDPVPLTVSIGTATLSPPPRNHDMEVAGQELLAQADQALYQAKETGRNRVCCFDMQNGAAVSPPKPLNL